MPAVSVIVPVYNAANYLEQCINSIVNQTFRDFELILVDDGSKDNSLALCNSWAKKDDRIVVIHKENGGLSSARNAGLDLMSGEYVTFLDSDDFWDLTFLEALFAAIQTSDAQIAVCEFQRILKDGTKITLPQLEITPGLFSGPEICHLFATVSVTFISAAAKLYCREIFDELRFVEGRINEDEAIAHRLFFPCTRVVCLNQKLYYYVNWQDGTNISSSGSDTTRLDAVDAFYDRVQYFLEKNDPALRQEAELVYLYSIFVALSKVSWFSDIPADRWQATKKAFNDYYLTLKQNQQLTLKHKFIMLGFRYCPRFLASLIKFAFPKGLV